MPTLDEVTAAVRAAWCRETCDDSDLADRTPGDPAPGLPRRDREQYLALRAAVLRALGPGPAGRRRVGPGARRAAPGPGGSVSATTAVQQGSRCEPGAVPPL